MPKFSTFAPALAAVLCLSAQAFAQSPLPNILPPPTPNVTCKNSSKFQAFGLDWDGSYLLQGNQNTCSATCSLNVTSGDLTCSGSVTCKAPDYDPDKIGISDGSLGVIFGNPKDNVYLSCFYQDSDAGGPKPPIVGPDV